MVGDSAGRRLELATNHDDPLQDGDDTQNSQDPQRHRQDVGDSKAGQQGGEEYDDESLGPLRDSHIRRRTYRLGTGLRIGDHLASHEAGECRRGGPRIASRHRPQEQSAKNASIRNPVEGGIEEVAPRTRST